MKGNCRKHLWLSLLLLPTTPTLAGPGTMQLEERPRSPMTYTLAIGVNQFEDSFWPNLRFAEKDARRWHQAMGASKHQITESKLLIGKDASVSAVESALEELALKLRRDDQLVVYISTHGTLRSGTKEDLEQVIVLQDTRRSALASTSLSHLRLRNLIDKVDASRKALILATCHSGVGKSRLTPAAQSLVEQQKGFAPLDQVSEGTLILAAASRGEAARESKQLQADIYTHFLLEAFEAGDRNRDGQISVLEAHDYARDRTYRFSKGRQRPTLESKVIGNGDVILAGKKVSEGLAVLDAYEPGFTGFTLAVEGGEKGTLPRGFALPPGKHRVTVEDADGTTVGVYLVSGVPGETLDLESILAPPPFQVGIAFGASSYSDAKASRVVGTGGQTQVQLLWNANAKLGLGLYLSKINSEPDEEAIDGVAISYEEQAWGIETRYSWRQVWKGWDVFVGGAIGQASMTLRLEETLFGDRMEASNDSLRPFVEAGARYCTTLPRVFADLGLTTFLQWSPLSAVTFGSLGSLDLSYVSLMFGVDMSFGANALKLN